MTLRNTEGGEEGAGPAFVAGASGYTGRAVVEELCSRSITTYAHIRPDSSALQELGARFEALGATVDTTPWEPVAMAATLARLHPKLVFGLLGTTWKRARQVRRSTGADAGYEAIDYGLTALLLRAAEALNPPPRFVYLSAIGVKKSRPGTYYDARWKVEQELAASKLPWTTVRPAIVSGPDREESRPMERLAAHVANGLLAAVGALGAKEASARYRTIGAPDLAKVLVDVSLDPRAAGEAVEPGLWLLTTSRGA